MAAWPMQHLRFLTIPAAVLLSGGCTTVAQVDNLGEPGCRDGFQSAIASILREQDEKPEIADALAQQTVGVMTTVRLGPRPFTIASPSGTDYLFFVEPGPGECSIHLYGRVKGFLSYRNNLTYIATQGLPGCRCSE